MFGVYIFITQYLQLVLGLSPLQAGLATRAVVARASSSARCWRRSWRAACRRWPILVGGLVAGASASRCWRWPTAARRLPLLIAGTVVMSLGMAPVFTIGNEMIITAAPPERAGAASALSETSVRVQRRAGHRGVRQHRHGGVSRQRSARPARRPAGRCGEGGDGHARRRHGRGARRCRRPSASALLGAARAAFVDALHLAALFGAAVVVVACVVTVRILRNGGDAQPETPYAGSTAR